MILILLDMILRPFRHLQFPEKLYSGYGTGKSGSGYNNGRSSHRGGSPLPLLRCAISTCAAHSRSDTFCIFFSQKVLAITVL
jgi:hypothetical protein